MVGWERGEGREGGEAVGPSAAPNTAVASAGSAAPPRIARELSTDRTARTVSDA